jgi:cytochrome bd ubiquinol oxidase subunit I
MHYPWWYVPFITSPMLIAIISVLHVVVSHYAVGGGFFLAVEVGYAYRTKNTDYLKYLKDHAWFFILVTVVYGAITGVGIWWTIGLASPLATEVLIHSFVFGWALEYVAFIIEITAAFIFFYYWGRLQPNMHVKIGWIYAGAAWISLVLITAITAFMLNPGAWFTNRSFWYGILNPQFIPQVLARTGGSFLLASLYVYLHASFRVKDKTLHNLIESRSARPALWGAIMIVLGGIGWLIFLPDSARAALAAASVLNVLMVIIFALTIAIFVMIYLGPYRNPGWFTPGFTILIFIAGIAAVTTGEYIREAVRKPYIIYNTVLANQILPEEISSLKKTGYLGGGVWTKKLIAERYPFAVSDSGIDTAKLLALPPGERIKIGQTLFQYHCNDCHAVNTGYSAVGNITRGWNMRLIQEVVEHPEKAHFFMPPWAGTREEAVMLTEYLTTIAPPHPAGMFYGDTLTGGHK